MGSLFFLPLSLIILSVAWGQEITFKKNGQVLQKLDVDVLKKTIGSVPVSVFDINEQTSVTYVAIPTVKLFNQVYATGWQKTEEVWFLCADGYQPSLATQQILEHPSYLAFERKDSKEFFLTNRLEANKKVLLGPLYLIWTDQKEITWPYQITGIDITNFKDRFPQIAPPESSSVQAKQGFLLFRKSCLGCHAMNGEGGHTGPELNFPVSVTEYYREDYLKRWIADPSSIRYQTSMPSPLKDVKERSQIIDDIVAYLKVMAKNKKTPKTRPL
jgi:cytochrome c2